MSTVIELSAECEQRLAQLAARCEMTRAALLNELIEQGLADRDDEYHVLAVLERVRTDQEPIYSAANVRKVLELDY
ncbi:hypothetical protein CKO09_04240 [Chromatium weissei]|nr:hypothetical protein [Chromatium weissei]